MLRRRRRGSLEKPPRVPWVLGPGKKYAVFLSHYKDEAGMEARYLRDLLQKVLRKPCFLDSQNLSSLSNLFTHGLLCSDSLVLLTTKDVLRRPYCLLELWCAWRANVPIVVLEISGRGFSWTDAERILDDIEGSLDSPEAAALIKSTLAKLVRLDQFGKIGEGEPPTLHQFGKDIGTALRVRERAALSETSARGRTTLSETSVRGRTTSNATSATQVTFHPWATDSGIIAAVLDVVDLLFVSVGRAPSPSLARAHQYLLGKRGESSTRSSRGSRWGLDQLGSSKAGWSMRRLERGLLGGSNKASNGLSSEGRPSLRSAADVRSALFGSHDSPPSPRKYSMKDPRMSLRGRKHATLVISCCRHEEEALEAANFLQEVSGHPRIPTPPRTAALQPRSSPPRCAPSLCRLATHAGTRACAGRGLPLRAGRPRGPHVGARWACRLETHQEDACFAVPVSVIPAAGRRRRIASRASTADTLRLHRRADALRALLGNPPEEDDHLLATPRLAVRLQRGACSIAPIPEPKPIATSL